MTVMMSRGPQIIDSSAYVPGTDLPRKGTMRTLTFEQQRDSRWKAEENGLLGRTIFVVNDRGNTFPTEDKPTWQVKIDRVLADAPSKANSSLYYRVIVVNLFAPVVGTKVLSPVKPKAKDEPKSQEVQPALPPARTLTGICFMEVGDQLVFSFRREDNVIEEFILEGERPGLTVLKNGDGTRFTSPISVVVTREIDVRPKFKKYAVWRK